MRTFNRICVTLDPDIVSKVVTFAESEDRSVSNAVSVILKRFFRDNPLPGDGGEIYYQSLKGLKK
jgi:hypothetical protein